MSTNYQSSHRNASKICHQIIYFQCDSATSKTPQFFAKQQKKRPYLQQQSKIFITNNNEEQKDATFFSKVARSKHIKYFRV